MKISPRGIKLVIKASSLSFLLIFFSVVVLAEENKVDVSSDANNPLAKVTAFNIQNYFIGELTNSDESANQLIFRFAKPLTIGNTNWLMRASLPVNSFPVNSDGSRETNIGDFDIFATYLFETSNPAVSFGIGPQIVAPTAGDDRLGSEQWQLGLAAVYFNASSKKFQYGALLTYRSGIGDTNGRERVSLGAVQPFGFYQFQKGWYTGMAPIWNYDFNRDDYNFPVGLRLGKVIKSKKEVYNLFVEPQYSLAHEGAGQAEWQIFMALNIQFLN